MTPRTENEIKMICNVLGIEYEYLFTKKRKQPLPDYRFMVFKFLREVREMTLIDIGRIFGKDHTSVIHGIRVAGDRIATEDKFRSLWKGILALTEPQPFTSMGKQGFIKSEG